MIKNMLFTNFFLKRGEKFYEDVNMILFFRKWKLRDSSEVMQIDAFLII